jgi:hypothetical protein
VAVATEAAAIFLVRLSDLRCLPDILEPPFVRHSQVFLRAP